MSSVRHEEAHVLEKRRMDEKEWRRWRLQRANWVENCRGGENEKSPTGSRLTRGEKERSDGLSPKFAIDSLSRCYGFAIGEDSYGKLRCVTLKLCYVYTLTW
ncbi:unnamed protein product [Calypogeia fissa]